MDSSQHDWQKDVRQGEDATHFCNVQTCFDITHKYVQESRAEVSKLFISSVYNVCHKAFEYAQVHKLKLHSTSLFRLGTVFPPLPQNKI